MKRQTTKLGLFALTPLLLLSVGTAALVQGDTPPGDTHGSDLYLGLNTNGGTAGNSMAVWFSDSSTNPNRLNTYLATSQTMTPNINGPAGSGSLFFNLGTNVVTAYPNGNPQNVTNSARMQLVSISPGLKMYASDVLLFDYNPALTLGGNKFDLPYAGGGWHKHYNIRAFKTGTYTFAFKYTNGTSPLANPVGDSPTYTYTLRNRAVVQGKIIIDSDTRLDNTPYGTGKVVRFYVFLANSNPENANEALVYTDVYLEADGSFGIPELLKSGGAFLVNGGSYRIGVQSRSVRQTLPILLPGNIVISPTSPSQVGDIHLPLGDINGDNAIDFGDMSTLLQVYNSIEGDALYSAASDINGDGGIDFGDLSAMLQSYNTFGDFTPLP